MKIEEEVKRVYKEINEKLDNCFSPKGKVVFLGIIFVAFLALVYFGLAFLSPKETSPQDMPEVPKVQAETEQNEEESMSEIDIEDVDNSEEKMVSLSVEDYGRSNPFLPSSESLANTSKYGFELMAPPESLDVGSEAEKVMGTKVSGIMFEPKDTSAILNIEGMDYLVRSGDYINNYKVLSISKDLVTVQLGANVYKAKVGEVISDAEVNYNEVYNLQNRFGGAKK